MIAFIVGSLLFLMPPSHQSPPTTPYLYTLDQIASTYTSQVEEWTGELHSPKAETLSFVIQAGDVLIFNLPEIIEGRPVDTYSLRKSPALSWIYERSFFWRTLAKDVGKHEILLSGTRNGVQTEELVIQVDIR